MERRKKDRNRGGYDRDKDRDRDRDRDGGSAEIDDLNRQIEKLERDLSRRDREIEEERSESERIAEKLKKIDRENAELRREVEDSKEEAMEYLRALEDYKWKKTKDEEEEEEQMETDVNEDEQENEKKRMDETGHELVVQEKNYEINKLLEDIEKMEEDKEILQSKLVELKDSLQEATAHIENTSKNTTELEKKLVKNEEVVRDLKEQKNVLEIRVKDLVDFKKRHDEYLENLSSAVDIRVEIWKKMMAEKDDEIEKLNDKISTLLCTIPHGQIEAEAKEKTSVHELKIKILERDEQLMRLNEKLLQATEEIESNTKIIENLQSRLNYTEDPENTEKMIKSLQSKIRILEKQLSKNNRLLKQIEDESEEKSKEFTNLQTRMTEYEAGIYGLSSAVGEIKELRERLRVRDKHIDKLTEDFNMAQMEKNELLDENEMFREKFGIEMNVNFTEETKSFVQAKKSKIIVLQSKVYTLEENIIQLKTRNYSIKKQLQIALEDKEREVIGGGGGKSTPAQGKSISGPSPGPEDKVTIVVNKAKSENLNSIDWKEKYEIILEENTELRKGLQEILDSLQKLSEEGTYEDNVLIESPILENLLREMSSRGLINYPYPISSFHLKVCNLEGKNSQLREENHHLRLEEKNLRTELINSKTQIQTLEEKLSNNKILLESALDEIHSQSMDNLTSHDMDNMTMTMASTEVVQEESISKRSKNLINSFTQTDVASESESYFESGIQKDNKEYEVEEEKVRFQLKQVMEEKKNYEISLEIIKTRIKELEKVVEAKDKIIHEFQIVQINQSFNKNQNEPIDELKEAIQAAQESVGSLQERLKTKEENINQYRKLLGEVRAEMSTSTERHVQEMRALQMTIFQQQQAFTRMKSTLSQPVKDTMNIEETIKDQLTRINELEDEVSELQHALGNVASQLASARNEAHRWRLTSDSRLKELDMAREKLSSENIEELSEIREKYKEQKSYISQLQIQLTNYKSTCQKSESAVELVSTLQKQLEEKDLEIELYSNSLQKSGVKAGEKAKLEELLNSKEKELEESKESNKNLTQKVSGLQVRLSKINAVNTKNGVSAEMEELRKKNKELQEEKYNMEKKLDNFELKRDEDNERKRKNTESLIRWEEGKKFKKTIDKLELNVKELTDENLKLGNTIKTQKSAIARLEKEKIVLDSRLKAIRASSSSKGSNVDTSSVEGSSSNPLLGLENHKLKEEVEELKDLLEKTEFEGREEIEKLKMEIKCLKERIISQERQIQAFQIAQKGDPKIVAEIEKMASNEENLQKEVLGLEEENLHLKLQLEQLRLDTPRLRDRVQHLQKMVDALKTDKSSSKDSGNGYTSILARGNSKSLSELERTIGALKQVIEKLQFENKQLRFRPASKKGDKFKNSLEALMGEKKALMDQVQNLEDEKSRLNRLYLDSSSKIESVEDRLEESEKKSKSLEMKLKAFLIEPQNQIVTGTGDNGSIIGLGYDSLYMKMRDMQEELERKNKLLSDAKVALKHVVSVNKDAK